MKFQTTFKWILAIIIMFSMAACQSTAPVISGYSNPEAEQMAQCAPEWFLTPPTAEDAVYGVGIAKMQNIALAKKTADSRARDDIAMTIKTKIGTMMKDFMQQSGIGDEAQSLQVSQSVSKQVASVVLNGCKIEKRKVCPEGMYSLASWSVAQSQNVKNEIADKTKKLVKNEYALYNEFKAKQGFDSLSQELDKLEFTEK